MSGQRWTNDPLQNQNANFIHNTFNSANNDLIANIFREMGGSGPIIVDNVATIDATVITDNQINPNGTWQPGTERLADLAGLQVGQYADINGNDELLHGTDVPQNMHRSLEGIIAERQASIAVAAAPIGRPDDFDAVRGQITAFVRKFFSSAADYLKRADVRNPSEAEVSALVERGILNVQPVEDMDAAIAAINEGLAAVARPDASPLENFKSQSAYFFNDYAGTGRLLIKVDQDLKQKLAFFDSAEKQLAALSAAAEEATNHPLHTAYFDYIKRKAEHLNIEETYKKYLALSKEWSVIRDLALLHRIPANAEAAGAPTCSVCLEDPVTVALLPCGHCFCTNCKGQIGRRCPLCRTNFTGSQRLFFA
jgi:hypothetical protein